MVKKKLAEGRGFEPTLPCGKTVFKTVGLQPLTHASINLAVI